MSNIYYPSWPYTVPQQGVCYCPFCTFHSVPKTITTMTATLFPSYQPRHRKPGPAQ